MKYIALLIGEGDGCDYTIGCNRTWEIFDAKGESQALERCKGFWEDRGGSQGEPRIESIELYHIQNVVPVPVESWNEQDEIESDQRAAQEELDRAQAKVKELQRRLTPKP